MGTLWASIDIGSNSVRYLVAEYEKGVLSHIMSGLRVTRISENIRHIGAIQPVPLKRTCDYLKDVGSLLRDLSIPSHRIFPFCTEAIRIASNQKEVIAALESALKVNVRVIDGYEEARLGRIAVIREWGEDVQLFDLGGGSMEISWSNGSASIPVGAVAMTERFFSLGEGEEEMKSLSKYVGDELHQNKVPPAPILVGIGGTATTIAALIRKINPRQYDPVLIHGARVKLSELCSIKRILLDTPLSERSNIPGMPHGRADIMLAGTLVIEELMIHDDASCYTVSERGILWGEMIGAIEASDLKVSEMCWLKQSDNV